MQELGVGVVYWTALDPIVASASSPVSVVELEPQTLWEQVARDGRWRYRVNESLLDKVAALPQRKLLHGVGHPIGGTTPDPIDPFPLLRRTADRLNPAWVSEHLSFNRVRRAGKVEHAGFLLPPPQSPAGARVAAHNIGRLRHALDRPVAFETGVNYLRPSDDDQLSDGDFFATVAQAADSGIVLDLHNLWCNERNERQNVADALARMPLDRVWEVHLAGGCEEHGYRLDAHDGCVPPEVIDIAAKLIPRLANLGALIFEILPEHLPAIGLDGVQRQIESLRALWRLRRPTTVRVAKRSITPRHEVRPGVGDIAAVAAWELALVDAIRDRTTRGASHLQSDPGCALFDMLIGDFRRANLARVLHYTLTALLAGLGASGTRELLDAYFSEQAPEPFGAVEGHRFAEFLSARLPRLTAIPYLAEVLAFEHALLKATIFSESSEIAWSADPTLVFDALDAGHLPRPLPSVHNTMRICAG